MQKLSEAPLLPAPFYARDAVEVARDVLGSLIVRGGVTVRITEVEAYRWPGDTACHGRHGRTARNTALWGPPGTAYVYFVYGIHHMLNLVTGSEGEAQAVLIRAAEPVKGLGTIRRRRGAVEGPALLNGPAKVAQALGLDRRWNGHRLHVAGGLEVRMGFSPPGLLVGPRVGVDFADRAHRLLPWRFAAANTPWVSHRKSLRPL